MEYRDTSKPTGTLYQQFNTLADSIEQQPSNTYARDKILGIIACGTAPGAFKSDLLNDAPFVNYVTNSATEWHYESDQTIRDYLQTIPFATTAAMPNEDMIQREINFTSDIDQNNFTVPLHYIISAAGFNSWQGRRGTSSRDGDGGKSMRTPYPGFLRHQKSIDVMKHYASLNTSLPPVHTINLYIQPDNDVIFGDNESGDSHRIGAAMLRGSKSIQAKNISVKLFKPDQS